MKRTTASIRSPRRAAEDPGDVELATLCRALGHPARVAIMRMLLERGECVCGGIVDRLPLAQATVSQHLTVLREAGLVQGTLDPPRVCYCADSAVVKRLRQMLEHLESLAADPSQELRTEKFVSISPTRRRNK